MDYFNKILPFINPTNVLIWISFILVLFIIDYKKEVNRWVLFILFVYAVQELVTIPLLINRMTTYYYKMASVCFILSQSAWIYIFKKAVNHGLFSSYIISLFVGFGILDLLYLEAGSFNSYTFVCGALLYVGFFIYESYTQLNKENLDFFKTKEYILLFGPILYFLVFSVIFSFKSKPLNMYLIGNIELYDILCSFINWILYGCVLFYVYKDHKERKVLV